MEYEISSCGYNIVFDSSTIDAVIGSETVIEVEQAINYIKSGEKEIATYVNNVSKPELDNHVETVNKVEISRYIKEEKQLEIEEYIDNYINTESKPALQIFADEKTVEFDNNAQAKQAQVDEAAQSASQSASEAKVSETNAKNSETNAKASEISCKDALERLGTVIKIKGRVDRIDDLPSTGNLNGDVYLVGTDGLSSYPEYYWLDDHWEFLGTSSDKLEWGALQGTLSNQTDLQQALDNKVSLTGNQTVGGSKIFTGTTPIKLSRNGNNYTEVMATSNGTTRTGGFRNINDNHNTTMMYVTSDDGTQIKGNIGIVFDGTSAYTQAPTPATNDSTTKIATTANVDAKITAQAVKLSGDQTVAGNKTFTGTNHFQSVYTYFRGKVIDITNAPTTQADVGLEFQDKNGTAIGQNHVRTYTNGAVSHNMYVKSHKSNTWANIGIGFAADDTVFTYAPTPSTNSNGTNIATTAWVNTRLGGTGITSTEIAYLDGVSSNIQTQLNGKANTSASNFNATGKSTILGWCIPNYSAGISINQLTSYTAPSRGLFIDCNNNTGTKMNVFVNGNKLNFEDKMYLDTQFIVDIGDVITCNNGTTIKGMFFPFKGA